MSLALAHKRRVIAEREQQQKLEQSSEIAVGIAQILTESKAVKGDVPAELQKLEQQLNADLETLKILKGDQQRDPLKKQMIEKYRPLCEWYMQNFEDWGHLQSLAWWLVWRSDLEDFANIEPLLYQGVEHGLTAPTAFQGTWQAWYCDVVKNHYSKQLKDETKADEKPDETVISKVIADITNGNIVLNKPLKAKLFAIYGKVVLLREDHQTAVKAFEKALSFDEAVGVKKLLKASAAKIAAVASGELDAENGGASEDVNESEESLEDTDAPTAVIKDDSEKVDGE